MPTFQRFHERITEASRKTMHGGRESFMGRDVIIKVPGAWYLHQLSFLRAEVHVLQLCLRRVAAGARAAISGGAAARDRGVSMEMDSEYGVFGRWNAQLHGPRRAQRDP